MTRIPKASMITEVIMFLAQTLSGATFNGDVHDIARYVTQSVQQVSTDDVLEALLYVAESRYCTILENGHVTISTDQLKLLTRYCKAVWRFCAGGTRPTD